MKAFIVYQDYELIEEKTIVRLFGRMENGCSFVTINDVKPYFFIRKEDAEKIKKYLPEYEVEDTNLTNFKGEKVVKISSSINQNLKKLGDYLKSKSIETYEEDLKPHLRFLIEKDINSVMEIEGDYEKGERVDRIYKEPLLKPVKTEYKPKLKIVSIDAESDRKGRLFCIGICSENYEKNFMVTDKILKNTVSCKNEEECLQKFKEEIIKIDPDIITGWNIINFDLPFLQKLFKKHEMQTDLGRTNENMKLRIEKNFFRNSSADIPGRVVLDGISLIKDPFIQEAPKIKNAEYKTYSLEDVAQAFLKKGKLIRGENREKEIEFLYNSNSEKELQKLSDYNLMDCKLAYEIFVNTDIKDLEIERSILTGLPMDRLNSSIAAFDSLYIKEARKRALVSPTTVFGEKKTKIRGGYVYSEKAGIFKNVVVLDFKSLYPSIIRTFNIDPASYLEEKEKNAIESPNKAYFKNEDGILPMIIEGLHQAREKAKKEKRELASYAIKTIMNSFFGVLASPNSRYFNLKIANAITHFGQMIIKLTAEEIEKKGYNVIYMDTDSIFIETKAEKETANKIGLQIQEYINNFYKEYVLKKYNRRSYLDLQFAKQYLSLLIPQIRKQEDEKKAAKKRYAGLIEKNGKEEIEVVGLESIRGDWTDAAKIFQIELLKRVFKEESLDEFIKDYIKKIKEGKMDDKLIYKKSIRKELKEYTKTTPPHVKAARKLDKLESNIIEYYITTDGPEPVQKLKHKIDYEHYIEKQIKPIAEQILSIINKSFDDLIIKTKQSKLFS